MLHRVTVLPGKQNITAATGSNLLNTLRMAGCMQDAPCGGNGTCGKCKVILDGKEILACQTSIDRDMTIRLPEAGTQKILTDGIAYRAAKAGGDGFLIAIDIGTTTVAGYLLDAATGAELACGSRQNPQTAYGADVITRIQHALDGQLEPLTDCIRGCVTELIDALCKQAQVMHDQLRVVSIVGNPAMQQLFLGIAPVNLAQLPFAPVLTQAKRLKADPYLPGYPNAELLIVPDVSGFVGADTVACVLATDLDQQDSMTLLVDIGTNGEMVLGNKHRMVACSAAAGPALEGANIRCGMRAKDGAIDHVWLTDGTLQYSVIGEGNAAGICGSGLIDAVAVALELGLINQRGKICGNEPLIRLTPDVYLTQDDIRQVQLAKGAIAAGIELMAAHLGICLQNIQQVMLAGAFGTFLDPRSACRIGLLPPVLADKIQPVGNAAGSGAKRLACDTYALDRAQELVSQIEFLELASLSGFARCFAKNMRF